MRPSEKFCGLHHVGCAAPRRTWRISGGIRNAAKPFPKMFQPVFQTASKPIEAV
ncbi:lumazine-binding protein [Neisseria bacilliformis ATCC BAA-1200]|uniref:Lumazine-binding protein n=1 Tax=Neisseria bacilliformis ATCC BAA-1200 TaxID=888742 RepID=F2BCT5_9NEIS|nr:lumazine-binding protein [Neisseria bacilliformis ATCC BAA-1200]